MLRGFIAISVCLTLGICSISLHDLEAKWLKKINVDKIPQPASAASKRSAARQTLLPQYVTHLYRSFAPTDALSQGIEVLPLSNCSNDGGRLKLDLPKWRHRGATTELLVQGRGRLLSRVNRRLRNICGPLTRPCLRTSASTWHVYGLARMRRSLLMGRIHPNACDQLQFYLIRYIAYQPGQKRHHFDGTSVASQNAAVARQRRETKQCGLREWHVDFASIQWDHWILQPTGYDANYCAGTCLYEGTNMTNNAFVRAVYRQKGPENRKTIPSASCVPVKYNGLKILYRNTNGTIVIKEVPEMSAAICGCL